ncbi:MAG: hypothetical protein K2L73_01740 [Muribaculaceae bacterium]|nr:hypothetical protein [Muribaculaceae bacterium]
MKRLSLLILTLLAAGMFCQVSAQHNPNRQHGGTVKHVIGDVVNISDSVDVYKTLISNIPVDKDFLNDPVFAIVGKNKSFYFSIGANFKFVGSYDWGNPSDDPMNFSVGGLQPSPTGDNRSFGMSAQGSNIYFNIIGFPQSANQIGLFLSLALDKSPGNEYLVHANYVYVRYRHLLVGYSSSLYNDKAADPFTIDSHGPIASGAHDNIQINFQKNILNHFRFGVGVEAPDIDYTPFVPEGTDVAGFTGTVRQRIPDIPFYIGYNVDTYTHMRLSGIVRGLTYRNGIEQRNHTVAGWGLKFTGSWVADPFVLYAQAQGGKGIATYIQDNDNLGLDLVPDRNRPGHLISPWAWGCIAGVQYNITDRIFATGVYSYLHNYVKPYTSAYGQPYDSQLRSGHYILGNVIWQISPLFRTGIEYVHGIRNNCDRTSLSGNRLYALLSMSF